MSEQLGEGYPVILLVCDGLGVAAPSRGNAVSLAHTPVYDRLVRTYPAVTLQASGEVVGLPWGEMGNSEVGHLNMGGGKIVYQTLPHINKTVADGSFYDNQQFLAAVQHAKANDSKLHLMGLIGNGGIHSSQSHLYALVELCKQQGVQEVYIHAFLDGRDTPYNSGLGFMQQLQERLNRTGIGQIASMAGRFWAMDRDNRWERTEQAFTAIRYGESEHTTTDPLSAIEESYQRHVFDEEIPPTVVMNGDMPVATVSDNDAVIFFNFRADRARQLTKAFVLPTFTKFQRPEYLHNVPFVTMTEYEKNLPVKIAFAPDEVEYPVARVVSDAGLRQLHIAETEKYAHVTFFFNGGQEEAFPNEDRTMVPSPRVSSYAEAPAMSADAVTQAVIDGIEGQQHSFIVANFANADMVGHTGDMPAAIQAMQELDRCLGKIAEVVERHNATMIITADHGNVEEMINLHTGEIVKEHTTNPVPFMVVGHRWAEVKPLWPQIPSHDLSQLQPIGVLADVAPTVLNLLGLPVPEQMTARSLIQH